MNKSLARWLGTAGLLWAACAAVAQPLPSRAPFYLLPTVEGLMVCDEGAANLQLAQLADVEAHCLARGQHGAERTRALLNQLEPGGPKGQVQVGFVATLQLLSLYQRTPKGWEINTRKLDTFLKMVSAVGRPVLLYLAADHFDSQGPLVDELVKDPRNLMHLANGTAPMSSYFGYRIVPYTLQTDEAIPVNRYRYQALRHVVRRIKALPAQTQKHIVGVSLLGEVHHMFPDFENGMAQFDQPQVTDHSPASVAGFRQWLAQRHTLAALNTQLGTSFRTWADVPAPGADKAAPPQAAAYAQHANGWLPITGWLWWPEGKTARVAVLVNGVRVAEAARGFNRLDVYRAVAHVTDPNVGFRHDLDLSQLPPGQHHIQVVAENGSQRVLLGESTLTLTRTQGKALPTGVATAKPTPAKNVPGLQTWLDRPGASLAVAYNPLAREWDAYRAAQVKGFLQHFVQVALDAGLPPKLAFSHQIVPRVNATWNHQLFAVEDTLAAGVPWQHGVNMYGGATHSPWLSSYMQTREMKGYGVPEFNPQQWKTLGVHAHALRAHYTAGAKFVSPYYLSVVPQRFRAGQHGVNAMEIRPDNPADGSAPFYEALRAFAAH